MLHSLGSTLTAEGQWGSLLRNLLGWHAKYLWDCGSKSSRLNLSLPQQTLAVITSDEKRPWLMTMSVIDDVHDWSGDKRPWLLTILKSDKSGQFSQSHKHHTEPIRSSCREDELLIRTFTTKPSQFSLISCQSLRINPRFPLHLCSNQAQLEVFTSWRCFPQHRTSSPILCYFSICM